MMMVSKSPANGLRATAALVVLSAATVLSSCSMLYDWRDKDKGIQIGNLQGPPGYRVTIFASGLPTARHMVMGERGTLFVGSSEGNVYALSLNGSAVIRQRVLLSGLTDPSGVAFHDGALFVADRTRILRFDSFLVLRIAFVKFFPLLEPFPNQLAHRFLILNRERPFSPADQDILQFLGWHQAHDS